MKTLSRVSYVRLCTGLLLSYGWCLQILPAEAVDNDYWTNASVIAFSPPSTSLAISGWNFKATAELGEPNHAGASGGTSVWWRWTNQVAGIYRLDTMGSQFDTVLAVYTNGASISSLQEVVSNDNTSSSNLASVVTFEAVANECYFIAVDSSTNTTTDPDRLAGLIALNLYYLRPVCPPPANDMFADAKELVGESGIEYACSIDASTEPEEPQHAGNAGGCSVWWKWTAPTNEIFELDTAGSSFDTLLAVYTGTAVNHLTVVASNAVVGGGFTNVVAFTPLACTNYYIAVDGLDGANGDIVVVFGRRSRPSNDHFTNSAPLSGVAYGSNRRATKESGEPNHAGNPGGKSVWWIWWPEQSGLYTIDTDLSSFDTLLAVYYGWAVDDLKYLASDDDSSGVAMRSKVLVRVNAGVPHRVAVDGFRLRNGTVEEGNITLGVGYLYDHDQLEEAVRIPNAIPPDGWHGFSANQEATKRDGEPKHANNLGGASMWWYWTPTSSGVYQLDTFGSTFDTLLGVYTGNEFPLSLVVSNDNAAGTSQSSVSFTAQDGTTYRIAVDGFNYGSTASEAAQGNIKLNLKYIPVPPPPNNNIAKAFSLSGYSATTNGYNVGADWEQDEPNHVGDNGGVSIWYKWKAPKTGWYQVDTLGSSFDTLLAVYQGSSMGSLQVVASNNDFCGIQSRVVFDATESTLYRIAVDGCDGAIGTIQLTLAAVNPPAAANCNYLPGPPAQFTLDFYGDAGQEYAVEFKSKLDDPEWQELASYAGKGNMITAVFPAPDVTGFYRLLMRPQ
jgi:hypothetical protein